MKTKAKPAAKKAAKSAPKKTAKKYVPPGKAKAAEAKAAKKAPAKKAAKIAKQVNAATRKPQDPKTLKVVTGHKAGSLPGDVTKNGVLQPREGTQGRKLWTVCDNLKAKLGRPPARFEFRKAIQNFKGHDGESNINPDSASFQYFAWRKFHGIKGRSIGIYPKRNSFEANTPAPAKVATKKAAKVPAKKTTAADVKRHERLATAAIGKPPAKGPAKKAAKTPAKASKPKPAPEAPKASERAAKASEAAKATPGVVVVTPPPAPAV